MIVPERTGMPVVPPGPAMEIKDSQGMTLEIGNADE
jgi:hypothetical protein